MKSFTYYHGTSDLFLDSIKKHGLGGVNPNIDFKNLELLKYLYHEAELKLLSNHIYNNLRATTEAMVKQVPVIYKLDNDKEEVLNFRHDRIYIALSLGKASMYAALNTYGSEILERCITIYKLLLTVDNDFKIPDELNLSKIDKLVEINPKPIIIEIKNVSDYDLGKEDGKTAIESLNFLRYILPTLDNETMFKTLQFCNFELLKPVKADNLKFYNLIHSGSPAKGNFQYKLGTEIV